jgi:hypothetical protein
MIQNRRPPVSWQYTKSGRNWDSKLHKFRIKGYFLLAALIYQVFARGSFATVKQAEHIKTGQIVAIKIIEKDSENLEEREVCLYSDSVLLCFCLFETSN